jgi:hypothetical protein
MHGLRYNPPCKALFIVIVFFSLIFLVNAYFFFKSFNVIFIFYYVISLS